MTKIEGVPDGYELVRIGKPREGEFYIRPNGLVTDATFSFIAEAYPIVRKIEPHKPIEPPPGYRLLTEGEVVLVTDKHLHYHGYFDDFEAADVASGLVVGRPYSAEKNTPIARKIEPKVRPMTRDEFLAAWKQRGFCPLIDHEDDIDIVLGVIDEPTEFDPDIVNTDKHGWLSLDVLSRFKFASDETYLTVEE